MMTGLTMHTLANERSVSGRKGLRSKWIILGCLFLLSFDTFKYFPGMSSFSTVWLAILAISLLLVYLPYKSIRYNYFDSFELYIIAMILVVPIYVGMMAAIRFGQPVVYGVLSQRWILDAAVALFVCVGLQGGRLSLRDIERTLLICAWVLLALYMTIYLVMDPAKFASYEGFVGGGGVHEYEFKFDNTLIVFAFLYYSFKGYRSKSFHRYAAAAVFLAYLILVVGGRSQILAALGASAFFVVRWGSSARRLTFVPKAIVSAIALGLLLFAVAPNYMEGLTSRINSAVSVVISGQLGDDVSANARVIESAIAAPYVKRHWLAGNGSISHQWHGGYGEVLGGYFYPSDIGILGTLFVYGLLGLMAFMLPLGWAFSASRRMRKLGIHTPLADALFGFLLYGVVRSLVTGELVWSAATYWTFIIILCLSSRKILQIHAAGASCE